MLEEIKGIINEIRQNDADNMRCFDCGLLAPNFISVNNGVFICFLCAIFHKKYLDKNHSDICEINELNVEALRSSILFLTMGGNRRLKEFFGGYDLLETFHEDMFKSENFIKKYKSLAGEYYRNWLKSQVNNLPNTKESKPTYEEGRVIPA